MFDKCLNTEGYFKVCRILGVTSCDKTVVQGGLQNSPAIRVYPKRKLITIYTTVFSLRQKMSLGELLMDNFLYSTIHSVGHGIQHILHDPSPCGLGTISEEIRGRHELLAWLRHRGATKDWWFVGFCAILNWIVFPNRNDSTILQLWSWVNKQPTTTKTTVSLQYVCVYIY